MTASVILIEVAPRETAGGVAHPVRLAGGGVRPYHYGGAHWRAGLMGMPRALTSLNYTGTDIGGGGVPQALAIAWSPARLASLSELTALYWTDADITVWLGSEGLGQPPKYVTGKVLTVSADGGQLQIAMADPSVDLKRPLLVDRFAGTGGVEGPVEWAGRIRRRAWGRCANVEADPIDPANNIYCFADPARPIAGFDAVRDKGVAADPAAVTLLAWQGSVAATFTALQGAEAIRGGGVLAPSIACVKWWTEPVAMTADLRGEIGAGYVETAPEIVERIVAARSGIPFAAGTVAAAAAARPAVCQWLADDESMTVGAVLDQLLGDVSLLWVLNGGEIVLRRWEWGASVASVRTEEVRRLKVHKPVGTRRLGYRPNNHVMARGDIAAVLFANDVAFDDGTLLSNVQPAEAGATNGAPGDSPLGDDTAQSVVDGMRLNSVSIAGALADQELYRLEIDEIVKLPGGGTLRQLVEELGVEVDDVKTWVSLRRAVDTNGNAEWSIVAQNSTGAITGMRNLLTGEIGSLDIVADILRIVDPNGGDPIPILLYDLDNTLRLKNVYIENLVVGAVKTESIFANAVTSGDAVSLASPISGNGSWHTALTYTLIVPPSTPAISWMAVAIVTGSQSFPSGDREWNTRLKANSSQIGAAGGQKSEDSLAMSGRAVWAAGTHTFTVEWNGQSGCSLAEMNMTILWFKR